MKKIFFYSFVFSLALFGDSVQKLADDPRDRPIQVRHEGASVSDILCYAPSFSKGEGYVYLDYCTSSSVKSARYDVFGRIGFNLDGKWLCLTAPSSVTGIDGASTQDWDYLVLRPCVINDKNQKWRIENNAIYTADKRFRVKDYKYYAYISKDPKAYNDHKLTGIMNQWIQTIARPGNLSIKTPLTWLYTTQSDWVLYYLQNNQSSADPLFLYYNPENGHIAQYYTQSGELYCLTSNNKPSDLWNWASWESCIDTIAKEADKKRYWEPFIFNDNEGMLKDYWGNLLSVTTYGPNWGVPYAVSQDYLLKDTTNFPTSNFILSQDINAWNRFVNANLQDSLEYCPAPGGVPSKTRVKRDLPPNFELTPAWIGRLWQISISTDVTQASDGIGLCGICLLQSYQMVLELINYPAPSSGGGYLFDTAPERNPFISFSSRFPELAHRLEQTRDFARRNYTGRDNLTTRMGRAIYGMSIGMMPQYVITPSALLGGTNQINQLIQAMLNSPIGSVFILAIYRTNERGDGVAGHAQPAIRTRDGIIVIPTNQEQSLQEFTEELRPLTTIDQIRYAITVDGTRELTFLQTLRIQRPFNNPLSLTISQRNCTGEGDHRRGSRTLPSSALINQCSSGRCLE